MGIFLQALATRVGILSLSFIANFLVEDYDSCIFLVISKQPGSHVPNSLIGHLFASLAKWDALFFLQIAHEGYLYEKNHAFFPLFPMLIRLVALFLNPLKGILATDEIFLISGVIVSWTSFALGAYFLQELTNSIFKDKKFTQWTSTIYLLSPAGIFLTSM